MQRRIIYFVCFYLLIVNQLYSKNSNLSGSDTIFVRIDYENILYRIEKPTINSIRIYTNKTMNAFSKIMNLPDDDTCEISLILPSISVTPYSYYIYQSSKKKVILQNEFEEIVLNKKIIDYIEYEKIKNEIEVSSVIYFYETNDLDNIVTYFRVFEVYSD